MVTEMLFFRDGLFEEFKIYIFYQNSTIEVKST